MLALPSFESQALHATELALDLDYGLLCGDTLTLFASGREHKSGRWSFMLGLHYNGNEPLHIVGEMFMSPTVKPLTSTEAVNEFKVWLAFQAQIEVSSEQIDNPVPTKLLRLAKCEQMHEEGRTITLHTGQVLHYVIAKCELDVLTLINIYTNRQAAA